MVMVCNAVLPLSWEFTRGDELGIAVVFDKCIKNNLYYWFK